ncbi:hypothetical protein B7494_g4027 [Chlorociboria aeruginascens]|nr:hypothetical protein B7494_g4027 [Chlorociboria aeruginascens]
MALVDEESLEVPFNWGTNHCFNLSTNLFHRYKSHPPSSNTLQISKEKLDSLLQASERLQLPDEFTPVQVWALVCRIAEKMLVTEENIGKVYNIRMNPNLVTAKMAELIGTISAVAGLVSFGISTCRGLISYYSSFKDQGDDIASMYTSVDMLCVNLELLQSSIAGKAFAKDVVDLVQRNIFACESGLKALEKKLNKVKVEKVDKADLKSKMHDFGRKTLYPFRESTLIKLKETVSEVLESLNLALRALDLKMIDRLQDGIEGVQASVDKVGVDITYLKDSLEDEKTKNCIKWISTIGFYSKQIDTLNRRQPGTGKWLFKSEEFDDWFTGREKTLWCVGQPGSGKTILASAIIDKLDKEFPSTDVGLAYIYCNYKERETQTLANLLASIVQQLIWRRKQLPEEIMAIYRDHLDKGLRPSRPECVKMLQVVTKCFSKVYIVVDALDECDADAKTRKDLISEILNLSTTDIQLLCTSRNLSDIENIFQNTLRLDIRATDEDVSLFLRAFIQGEEQLSQFCESNPSLEEEIIETISKNANGMFLLAHLHITSVAQRLTVRTVRKSLKNLPEKLDDIYNEAMKRIKSQNKEKTRLALNLLSWISYTTRPLRIREVRHALAIMELEDDEDGREIEAEDLHSVDLLITICAGIVTIDNDSHIIRLVHKTTQEYFTRKGEEIFPGARYSIATSCLNYLSLDSFQKGCCKSDDEMEKRLGRYPLLHYAAVNWPHHMEGEIEEKLLQDIVDYLSNDNLRHCLNQAIYLPDFTYGNWSQEFPHGTSNLVVASRVGLAKVVDALIQAGADVNCNPEDGETPLIAAAFNGHEVIVKTLLEHGADPNTKLENISSVLWGISRGDTALHVTARKGDEKILQLLLKNGADSKARRKGGRPPAAAAAEGGHWGCMMTCLQHAYGTYSATLDANYDEDLGLCLGEAARLGHEHIVKQILDLEPEFKRQIADSSWGHKALLSAAENGHDIIVEDLLRDRAGKDHDREKEHVSSSVLRAAASDRTLMNIILEKKSTFFVSPLQGAAHHGNKKVVELLLESGVDVNIQGGEYGNALQAAVVRDYDEIALMLIDKDADVNAKGGFYGSALQAAAWRGNKTIVNLLLDHGADINLQHEKFGDALQVAAYRGKEGIIDLLLKRGAYIKSRGYRFGSPVQAAVVGQRDFDLARQILGGEADDEVLNCIELLLEYGAEIDVTGGEFGSALGAAAAIGALDVLEYLVQVGANIDVKCDVKGTPLQQAIAERQAIAAMALIEKGAEVTEATRRLLAQTFPGEEFSPKPRSQWMERSDEDQKEEEDEGEEKGKEEKKEEGRILIHA